MRNGDSEDVLGISGREDTRGKEDTFPEHADLPESADDDRPLVLGSVRRAVTLGMWGTLRGSTLAANSCILGTGGKGMSATAGISKDPDKEGLGSTKGEGEIGSSAVIS